MHEADWARDDVPDFIWPIALLQLEGERKYLDIANWRMTCAEELSKLDGFETNGRVDGRLTSLASLGDEDERVRKILVDLAAEYGLLPPGVSEILALYEDRPAPWFVSETQAERSEPTRAFQDLAMAIYGVLRDGHHEALIKCLPIWATVVDNHG